jgi:hypothetical protein
MKKFLFWASALLCAVGLSLPVSAQMTTVTASTIKMGGVAVATGTVTFTPVNSTGTPISIVANSSLFSPQGFVGTITAGAITGSYSVPDQCQATATVINTPVLYTIQVSNTTTKQSFTLFAVQGVCGSTWALDHYAPAQSAVISPTGLLTGGSLPAHCSSPSIYYTQTNPTTTYKCVGGVFVQDSTSGGGGGGTQHAYMRFASWGAGLMLNPGDFDTAFGDVGSNYLEEANSFGTMYAVQRQITITGVQYHASYGGCSMSSNAITYSIESSHGGATPTDLTGTAYVDANDNGYGQYTHAITGLNITIPTGDLLALRLRGTVPPSGSCPFTAIANIEYLGS